MIFAPEHIYRETILSASTFIAKPSYPLVHYSKNDLCQIGWFLEKCSYHHIPPYDRAIPNIFARFWGSFLEKSSIICTGSFLQK